MPCRFEGASTPHAAAQPPVVNHRPDCVRFWVRGPYCNLPAWLSPLLCGTVICCLAKQLLKELLFCRFGQARKDAEHFLGTFTDVYILERVSVMGDDARLLKCYPGGWQVGVI